MTDERRPTEPRDANSKSGAPKERPTEQDGYVAARDEAKTAERTEAEDRGAD
jgi:hypothetical protein